MKRIIFGWLMILAGLALISAVIYFLIEPPAQNSILQTAGQIFAFLLGAGASIKGWLDLFKKGKKSSNANFHVENAQIATGEYARYIQTENYFERVDHLEIHDNHLIQTSLQQLPSPPADFVGREKELDVLFDKLQADGTRIFGLHGIGGIGKTALALKFADLLKGKHPDAQLFLDLRGADKQNPLSPSEIMKYIIISINSEQDIPGDEQQLIARYRTVLNNRRALIFFDNVRDEYQIKSLIVQSCTIIITSRQHFSLPGMISLDIGGFSNIDAHNFVKKIEPRISTDDANEIAKLCGYLPLAIRTSVVTLLMRPDWFPKTLIDYLNNPSNRLDLVDATLNLSYQGISKKLQKRFRQLFIVATLGMLYRPYLFFEEESQFPNNEFRNISDLYDIWYWGNSPFIYCLYYSIDKLYYWSLLGLFFESGFWGLMIGAANWAFRILGFVLTLLFFPFFVLSIIIHHFADKALWKKRDQSVERDPKFVEKCNREIGHLIKAGLLEYDEYYKTYKIHDLVLLFARNKLSKNVFEKHLLERAILTGELRNTRIPSIIYPFHYFPSFRQENYLSILSLLNSSKSA